MPHMCGCVLHGVYSIVAKNSDSLGKQGYSLKIPHTPYVISLRQMLLD